MRRGTGHVGGSGSTRPPSPASSLGPDGRHRLAACVRAGVEPQFTTWEGADGTELDFVLGENLYRRHLTAGQRALLAADHYRPMKAINLARPGNTNRSGKTPIEGAVNGKPPTLDQKEVASMFGVGVS